MDGVTGPAPTDAAEMTARMESIDGLASFDAGRTVALPDGRWLSLTGDATVESSQLWPVYDNAAIIWDAAGERRVEPTQAGGHFLPRFDDGSEFWPNQFFAAGERVYVIGSRQLSGPDGSWTAMGAYGAVLEVPAGGDPRFLRYFPTPSSLLGDEAVQWYGAIAYDGTWVYVHGVRDRPDQWHARDGGHVARVALAQLDVPHRWQFWTGSGWSGRDDSAVPTIPTGGPTDGTTSGYTLHRRPDGSWAATTKAGGELASVLGRYVGPAPWGPWTWEPLLTVGGLDSYLAGAAPGIPTASGQLLVQWSRRGSTPGWAEVPQ